MLIAPLLCAVIGIAAQETRPSPTDREKSVAEQLRGMRQLPDDVRSRVTKQLALDIRALPAGQVKLGLASGLANLSTEGDFGRDTLQEVATTLATALREHPSPAQHGRPSLPYVTLAQLVRYEQMQASVDDPQFAAAMALLEANDRRRQEADFALTDLQGRQWRLRDLRGKVVLVNFWATWCPPCRKEMPDLDALYKRFKDSGFVVLAISDEDNAKVRRFIGEQKFTFPVLLDPGRKANDAFQVDSIPKTFIYDREGRLVATSIDMRTEKQFLAMLAAAGLK